MLKSQSILVWGELTRIAMQIVGQVTLVGRLVLHDLHRGCRGFGRDRAGGLGVEGGSFHGVYLVRAIM